MPGNSVLGIQKIFSFEFVVDFFDRSREFYVDKMGFVESHRSTRDWEDTFNSKAIVFTANEIQVMVSSPKTSHSYTAEFLRILSPGIRRVTFQVENLDHTVDYLRSHDATFIHEKRELRANDSCHKFITIASPIGFLEFSFVEVEGDPTDIPGFEKIEGSGPGTSPFRNIDHMTINTQTIYPICNFFEHVMGFEEFWRVAFHTPDYKSGKKGTGLTSRVMWDPGSRVKFATNEPLYPHYNDSQIQTFVNRNHGAGIQHAALAVDDLVESVRRLRDRGVQFLHTPETYYDILPERLKKANVRSLKQNLEDLKREKILVDGQDEGYLLQIFLKDASLLYHEDSAGPFFYEVIQRCGHEGFGEGNFRALFEAIEMQEQEA